MSQSIRGYLDGMPSEHKRIASALISLVQQAAPKAAAAVKWDQIAFEQNGPFCFIKTTPACVVFGFWRGQELNAAKSLLADTKTMAHVNLTAEGDIRRVQFQGWVKEAVRLNLTNPRAL
jgi:hypothetical protein